MHVHGRVESQAEYRLLHDLTLLSITSLLCSPRTADVTTDLLPFVKCFLTRTHIKLAKISHPSCPTVQSQEDVLTHSWPQTLYRCPVGVELKAGVMPWKYLMEILLDWLIKVCGQINAIVLLRNVVGFFWCCFVFMYAFSTSWSFVVKEIYLLNKFNIGLQVVHMAHHQSKTMMKVCGAD